MSREEKKQLLARKRATQKKILSSTNKNELKLFDYIYFNPSDNPMPSKKKKLSETNSIIGDVTSDHISDSNLSEVTSINSGHKESSNSSKLTEVSNNSSDRSTVDSQEKSTPVANDQSNENILNLVNDCQLDFNDLMKHRQEEETVENENLETEHNSDADSNNGEDDCVAAPQLKIGANGELVLDEKSLSIKTTAAKVNENVIVETVDENDDNYQYGKYNRKRKRSTDWTLKETARFYKALSTVGTDFLLMQSLFKWRSREELKIKFKKEERTHRILVDKALSDSTQFDFSVFEESDYDPDEDRKTAKSEDAKRKKELLKEQKKKLKEYRIKERLELKKKDKQRKTLLKRTFKPRKCLRMKRDEYRDVDEDSNDSRATSILIDAQEVILEMTLLDKERMDNSESIEVDEPDETDKEVKEPDNEKWMQETWFSVTDIQTDEMNKNFVNLQVNDSTKMIPVPDIKENTSHVVVVATNTESAPIYHVYLATCNREEDENIIS